MLETARWQRIALALAASLALAACETRTNVSASANVPAQYSHAYITVQEVGFNASSTASLSDSGWQEFALGTPSTFDLVTLNQGALAQFASSLKVPIGTYKQVRLILVDSAAARTSSAAALGAVYNDEVDYVDANGTLHQLPLQVPNAAQGIAIPISLKVEVASTGGLGIGIGGSATSGTTPSFSNTTTTSPAITTGSTTTTGTTGTGTGSTTTQSTSKITVISAGLEFDGARDLVPFTFSGQPGFVLNPHFNGNDLAQAGTIQGTLDLTALPTTTSGSLGIVATAETLSADGSRHSIVASTPVDSSGQFVLYPLYTGASSSSTVASSSNKPTQYDVIIHGPTIGTVIVKSIPVGLGAPNSGSSVTLPSLPVTAASTYSVNASSAVSPPGAWVGFYQTIPLSGEVPYLIEARPIDPFTGQFDTAQSLSSASLSFGTFSATSSTSNSTSNTSTGTSTTGTSSGTTGSTTSAASGTVTLTTVVPSEGAATYRVAGSASLYGDGPLTTTVTAPASGTTATFALTALPVPATATAASVTGTITVAKPGKYDKGELVLTHDGALMTVTPLDTFLSQGQSSATLFSNVPTGQVYYAEAWVWSSASPSGTLSRQPYSSPIDLTSGSASGISISIQ